MKRKKIILVVAVLILLLTGMAVWNSGWPLAVFYWTQIDATSGTDLRGYRVGTEAKPIAGLTRNVSGLTYHTERGTLFTVINSPPQVAELSIDGDLLRIIPVLGLSDIEGITHVYGDFFVLCGEAKNLLLWTEISEESVVLDMAGKPHIGLTLDVGKNVGFEGVSWDESEDRLFVVKEKKPLRIVEITGMIGSIEGNKPELVISEWRPIQPSNLFLADLSSVTFFDGDKSLLLLSDESHMVLSFNLNRQLTGMLVLRAGWHGLRKTIPQAEGIAMTPDGTLFIVSEPNLFYRFKKSGH